MTLRFMQRQAGLVHLGLARLKLLETFALSTIRQQTNQQFIWIIRADPDLDNRVKQPLISSLQNQSNIFLLGSNDNHRCAIRSSLILTEEVWSGDEALLQRYHDAAKERRFVVETRLDADDGLPLNFINTTQNLIDQGRFDQQESLAFYRFWCVRRHIEWHATNPFRGLPRLQINPYGYLIKRDQGDSLCITPGLTMVYGKEMPAKNIPKGHTDADNVPVCSDNVTDVNCWSFLYDRDDDMPGAIRARTPTSTGMTGVSIAHEQGNGTTTGRSTSLSSSPLHDTDLNKRKKWQSVLDGFGIHPDRTLATKEYFILHLAKIAADNLQGQCNIGHTCKPSAKKALTKLKSTGGQSP